ncbi:MAG: peptide deformylase [Actinomycetota bacterium]
MAVLPIRQFGDPVLRQKAAEIEEITDIHRRLIQDMLDTMREAPGVGLAGPQVGVMERIFVWETEDGYGAVINPTITSTSEEKIEGEEGCLSIPGLYYNVARSYRITVEGLDENGDAATWELEDFKARIFQHEIDHLDGVLFIDRLSEADRKEALAILRDQALGLPVPTQPAKEDEVL